MKIDMDCYYRVYNAVYEGNLREFKIQSVLRKNTDNVDSYLTIGVNNKGLLFISYFDNHDFIEFNLENEEASTQLATQLYKYYILKNIDKISNFIPIKCKISRDYTREVTFQLSPYVIWVTDGVKDSGIDLEIPLNFYVSSYGFLTKKEFFYKLITLFPKVSIV
jgi:hypothetical protein